MNQVQGVVQAVSDKIKPFQTKFGMAYNLSFKMDDGQWYKLKFCDVNEPIPLSKGMSVSFMAEMENRINPQTQQPIVDLNVNKKNLQILQQGQPMNQGYQAPQQGYQQTAQQGAPQQPQGGYPQQPPQQQQYQQQPPQQAPQQQYQQAPQAPAQPQGPQMNWTGKEGMATGMAFQVASNLTSNINELPTIVARVLLGQQEIIQNLAAAPDGGIAYLMELAGGSIGQAPQQAPVQQPQMPQAQPQQAPMHQAPPQQPAPQQQPGNPAPAGFGANPPPMTPQQNYTGG